MYGNLQEKYKSIVFQVLKIHKAIVILIIIRQLGRNTLDCANILK